VRAQESLLRRVFGVGAVAQHARRVSQTCRRMTIDQFGKCSCIAIESTSHQLGIRHSDWWYLGTATARH
jgi:hypothetical protein